MPAAPTVIPAAPTVIPGGPHRHSRVSGNPDGTEKTSPLPPNRRRIPAYAGMTVGAAALYRGDSRLRGKDGGETAAPLSSGFPLTREGR